MARPVFISFEGGEGSGKSTQAELLRDAMIAANRRATLVHEPGSTSLGEYLRRYLKEESVSLTGQAEVLLFSAARAQLVAEQLRPLLEQGTNLVADRYADSTLAYQGYGRELDLEMVRGLNAFATDGLRPDLTFLLDLSPAVGLARVQPQLALDMEMALAPNAFTTDGLRLEQAVRLDSAPVVGLARAQAQLDLRLDLPFTEDGAAAPRHPAMGGVPMSDEVKPSRQDEEGQRRFERLQLEFHQRVRNGYLAMAKQEPERWRVLDATLPVDELSEQVWQEVSALLLSVDAPQRPQAL